jgi:SAM-dependent methyltransferase
MDAVQIGGDEQSLNDLWHHVRRSWEKLGREAPYHSVLTAQEYLPQNFSQNEEAFWESGIHDQRRIEDIFYTSSVDISKLDTAFELGSGVGRVSMYLSAMFRRVISVDISSTHLVIAEKRALLSKKKNIEFKKIDLGYFEQMPPFDFFYSRIVLQHNPPPIILKILKSVFRALKPGGVAIFQVPVFMKGYSFNIRDYLASKVEQMEMHCVPQSAIVAVIKNCGCEILEIREDGDIGNFGSWVSNTFVVQK